MPGMAIFPRWSEEQLTVPRLSADGKHLEGWCRPPANGVWRPSEVLWMPPGAVKSADVESAAEIVDIKEYGIGEHAWITAELKKAGRYLDMLRERVRSGAYRMTAAGLRSLGFSEDEIARLTGASAELVPLKATVTPDWAAVKSYERLRAMVGTDEAQLKTIAKAATDRFAATGDMDAALDALLAAYKRSRGTAPIDPDTGLPDVGRS